MREIFLILAGGQYWNLGAKRVGNDVIWVQTGNRVVSANWHVWYQHGGTVYDLFRSESYYLYKLDNHNHQRKWYFYTSQTNKRFICEAS